MAYTNQKKSTSNPIKSHQIQWNKFDKTATNDCLNNYMSFNQNTNVRKQTKIDNATKRSITTTKY